MQKMEQQKLYCAKSRQRRTTRFSAKRGRGMGTFPERVHAHKRDLD